MAENLNRTLQENLITLLAHSNEHGRVVANLIDASLFEGDYRVIAERCVDYWRQFNEAPGDHTADLVDDILSDKHNRKASTYRRILSAMLQLSDTINEKYVIGQLQTFTRMQRLKDGILKSAELLNSQQEMAITDVEQIWNDLIHTSSESFDAGMRMTDVDRLLNYLSVQYDEFITGVEELDKRHVVPYRGATMLMLAPTGHGKSWWLINVGKQALRERKRVAHVTMEMSEEETTQRYYQSIFSITKREQKVEITTLEFTKKNKIDGFDFETVEPDFTFKSPAIRDELVSHVGYRDKRFDNLIIKRFAPRTLTPAKLRAYLDHLELTEHFIPDMLIVDYIGIMHTDPKNHRVSLGRTYEELRAIAVDRNLALVTAHQTSRESAAATYVESTDVAEDWSLIGTSDMVLTLSMTDMEKRYGLARIYVSKARGEADKFGVLITQNYTMGQFVLQSAPLRTHYFDCLKDLDDEDDDNATDDKK